MKTVSIIPKSKSSALLPQLAGKATCYYLSEDYFFFINLKRQLNPKLQLNTLSGLFNETLLEIIEPYQDLIAAINKESDSLYWWGHQLASKSSSATPLFRNTVYLLCCKKLLSKGESDLAFVIDSPALGRGIEAIASDRGWNTCVQGKLMDGLFNLLLYNGKDFVRSVQFLAKTFLKKYLAFRYIPSLFDKNKQAQKRVVLRSWVTVDTFHKETGAFNDRNFGCLPDFFRARGYEVWTMPMFFNLRRPLHELFKLMESKDNNFLIPEKYLTLTDFFFILFHNHKISRKRFHQRYLKDIDIAPLINEVLQRRGVDLPLCELNLCYLLLKKLRKKGFEVDTFLYPFENNAPEKLFILGCKEYYPNAKLIGFQHSAYYPNNMAFRLGSMEAEFHPLPDKIVCSGPIYQQLLAESGFPRAKLFLGQNLRFESVNQSYYLHDYSGATQRKKILLTLSFSYDQAFELFAKMKEVLKGSPHYEIFIRSHPLLSKEKIARFLDLIKFGPYQFAEGKTIQDWLVQMYSFITAGASITTLEAAIMGVPVVRLILDNSVTYDALAWPDYPILPANSIDEISGRLELIGALLKNDSNIFIKMGQRISVDFFTPPTEENLEVYF